LPEESAFLVLVKKQIPRCARDDKIADFFRSLLGLETCSAAANGDSGLTFPRIEIHLLYNKDNPSGALHPASGFLPIRAEDCSRECNLSMKLLCKCCLSMVLLALSSAAAFSAERAVLRNGFVMRLDHRETRGAVTRLFMDRGTENYVDIPGDQIVRFEAVPNCPPCRFRYWIRFAQPACKRL